MKKMNGLRHKLIKVGAVSAVLAAIVLVLLHFYWNSGPTYGYGNQIAKWLGTFKELTTVRVPSEDVICVSVSYDRTTVPYCSEKGDTLGTIDITDREKLAAFLNLLKERDKYRYVICDINFSDPMIISAYDDELFGTIASMRDIVVASSDLRSDPEEIRDKVALSEYMRRHVGDDFLKYDFMKDGNPSMALKIWQDLEGGTYEESWWGALMNGKLCLKTLIPDFKFAVRDKVNAKDSTVIVHNMCKILDFHKISPMILQNFDNKIVLLGSWTNDDIHSTIAGMQPGVVVVYNAYLALKNMDNNISVWIYLLVFVVVWLELMIVFRHSYANLLKESLNKRLQRGKLLKIKHKKARLRIEKFLKKHRKMATVLRIMKVCIAAFINYGLPLTILMVVVYLASGVFVNIIIVGFFLSIVNWLQNNFKIVP